MFRFCGHTGARRSEILRSLVHDFDFELRTVLIREKKRSHTQATTFRRVPISERLSRDMQEWFQRHPGGRFSITQELSTVRGKTRDDYGPLTAYEAADHFRRALKGTKWHRRVKGFHVLRHSFASNAAAAGVDQGMIDAWMGHQTEEMRNRYRHLFPRHQQTAIDRIFGNGQPQAEENRRAG